ncbi:Hypothetical protein CINCED_3A022209 [Cinara cedri]|uniref:Uncharacterized protein n=1 Tax=Cinara cedri TaxID=506608 RepID=A0A5E4M2V0_9HEMI|nr:Hypothetical protein CINCED_3A022209 [Cinara cedri]
MSENAEGCENHRQSLPARYKADGPEARWRRMWVYRNGSGGCHVDDDGADRFEDATGCCPPLTDEMREEGKDKARPELISDRRPVEQREDRQLLE